MSQYIELKNAFFVNNMQKSNPAENISETGSRWHFSHLNIYGAMYPGVPDPYVKY